MELLADTHVHIYPEADAARLIRGAAARLRVHARGREAQVALCLTEAAGCNYYSRLAEGLHGLPGNFRVELTSDPRVLKVLWPEGWLWILAGRQYVAAERVEILGLGMLEVFDEVLPARNLVEAVLAADGVPVLPWSPGKWMGKRALIVHELLGSSGPEKLLVGDVSMRPRCWPEPALMACSGRMSLAGSDPLPVPLEEGMVGSYGVRIAGRVDAQHPGASLCRLLGGVEGKVECIGSRNRPLQAARRFVAHTLRKKRIS